MLGRQGVTFTAEQQEMITTLTEQGRLFEAQNIILSAVEQQVGGTAAATATATDKIKIGWENVVGDLGERVLPVFNRLADFLVTKVFPAIGPLVDKAVELGTAFFQSTSMMSPFKIIWEQILRLLPVLMPILSAIGTLVMQVVVMLGPVLEQLITALVDALLPVLPTVASLIDALTPIILFLAAALAFLLPIIINVADFLLKMLVGAINIVVGVVVFLANVFTAVFNGIGAVFTWLWDYIIKPIVDLVVREFERWGRTFTWLYENIIEPVMKAVGEVFEWVWYNLIDPVIQWAISAFESIGETVADVFGGIGKFIEDTFKNIVGFVKGPVNAIIDLVNKLIKALNSLPAIEIPDWVPLVGGTVLDFDIPLIPKLGKGGYVDQPTTALIGEAGPEVVTPLKDFERMMGIGNGSDKGTINYYAAPNTSLDAEQALFDAMKRAKVLAGW
jgi:phage-related protein